MTTHSSARSREQTPHAKRTFRPNPVLNAVTRSEPVEPQIVETNHGYSIGEKIDALAEIICRCADESPAALLVLIATVEASADPKALANAVKHYAFARCAELNLFEMVDAQVERVEDELLAGNPLT